MRARDPPELGLLDREIKRVKSGRVLLIPGATRPPATAPPAKRRFWKQYLAELLQSAARGAK